MQAIFPCRLILLQSVHKQLTLYHRIQTQSSCLAWGCRHPFHRWTSSSRQGTGSSSQDPHRQPWCRLFFASISVISPRPPSVNR